jgi:hypothetical protein
MSNAATRPPKLPPPWFSTLSGAFIARSATSAAAASFGPRRTSAAGVRSPHDRRAEVRARTQRHHRLRRGRPEPCRARNERLGRGSPPRGGSTSRHTPTASFDWRTKIRARCGHALPRGRSVIGCGSAGSRSIRSAFDDVVAGSPRRERRAARAFRYPAVGGDEPVADQMWIGTRTGPRTVDVRANSIWPSSTCHSGRRSSVSSSTTLASSRARFAPRQKCTP